METLINCLCRRIVALRGARNLDYHVDMSRFLRSVRLALHPAQTINQGFHRGKHYGVKNHRQNRRTRT